MTQTQLPSKYSMSNSDLVRVVEWDTESGKVSYHGTRPPTSEFWLHQQIYDNLAVNCVVHGHAPVSDLFSAKSQRLWSDLKIFQLPEHVEERTLDLPRTVLKLLDNDPGRYIILTGHGTRWDPEHIGVVVMGNNINEISNRVLKTHKILRSQYS